jgi:hypothetical protein
MRVRGAVLPWVLIAGCVTSAWGDEKKLTAERWFNADERADRGQRPALLILFFETQGRENARWAREVNRIARRPDLEVVGVSPDEPGEVERFIRRHRLRFRIGAGSRSASVFGVHGFPALRRIERDRPDEATVVELTGLRDLGRNWSALTGEDVSRLEQWELMALAESDADGEVRVAAIDRLYHVADPNTFIRFAEERLPVEPDPWARGHLEFLSDIRRGIARQDHEEPPSVTALHAFREQPESPEWSRAREFRAASAHMSPAALGERYALESVEDPCGAMIRRFILQDLQQSTDRKAARRVLMDILRTEQDRSLRLNAVAALGKVCRVGDREAADFLDELAAREANVLHVRPILEYTSLYLRTGKEDRRYDESQAPAEGG